MKKYILILLLAGLFASYLSAETASITGKWLFTKAEIAGEVEKNYQIMELKENGDAVLQDITFGSWKYTGSGESVSISSDMLKGFNGIWEIERTPSGHLTLKGDNKILYFEKFDQDKINTENSASGLEGIWEIFDNLGGTGRTFIRFSLPDTVETVYKDEGSLESGSGVWIYDSGSQDIILMVHDEFLKGKHSITINTNSFVLDSGSDAVMNGKKLKENAKDREQLTMEPPETENLLPESFPWYNGDTKISALRNAAELDYRKSELLENINYFVSGEVKTEVSFNEEYNEISMDNIFGGLTAYGPDMENVFYPLEEPEEYTVISKKEISVPAGTFTCTEVEFYDEFEEVKVRAYMIDNRPGIYAKLIVLKNTFGNEEYTMYELSK